ncbi:methyltransferase domain-containing protein [Nonomuraea sp. NPDC048882]|uniref:methyltransferase domain-containing protein n=1 Tax=Nonomuraea sp. NPDC048882 TaxID=3154347 RepID=UPI0033D92ACD
MGRREYFTEYQQAEEERLLAQGEVFDPLTRRVFAAAGLARGMRVLDLGSGVGNVSRLAAEFVGPEGSVVGVDRDPDAVRRAARLAAARGQGTVEFRVGDIEALTGLDGEFDAVVGRLVLMYLADPAGALRNAASLLRPGGLICMHEADLTYMWSTVDGPTWRQLRSWIVGVLQGIGADPRMGPSLFATFRAAGLPDPEMRMEAAVGGGEHAPAFGWANIARVALPLMERAGIATAAEVDPDTLTERLLTEVHAEHGVVVGPCLYGAWARTPG